MDLIPNDLARAALDARARLANLSQSAARDGSPSAMASAARATIFADAVLAALHARLSELKSVAK
jgi:hypothetical protein